MGNILKQLNLLHRGFFLDLHVQKLCQQNSSLVLPHPHECQLYYDCSTKYNTLPPNFVQHMRECPFPDLFSLQTLRCEDYRHVRCDERVEFTTACKYWRINGTDLLIAVFISTCVYDCDVFFMFVFSPPSFIGQYRANQVNVYHVMCTIQDVEGLNGGQGVVAPGIMGLSENTNQDRQSTGFVNPKKLTGSRISLDELKKDLCSNKMQLIWLEFKILKRSLRSTWWNTKPYIKLKCRSISVCDVTVDLWTSSALSPKPINCYLVMGICKFLCIETVHLTHFFVFLLRFLIIHICKYICTEVKVIIASNQNHLSASFSSFGCFFFKRYI